MFLKTNLIFQSPKNMLNKLKASDEWISPIKQIQVNHISEPISINQETENSNDGNSKHANIIPK